MKKIFVMGLLVGCSSGTHVSITHTPAATGAPNMIYDHGWAAEDVFDPPRNNYTTEKPFQLAAGDKIAVECTYNNTTGAVLPFPSEMCVAWQYGYPLTQEINCTDGNWPR